MDSVALDVFSLPHTHFEGQEYDCVVLCVDRHSGWMMAMPTLQEGLTAEKVGKWMAEKWDCFGIPSVVISDQGPPFEGKWWKTICARLGVNQMYG